MQTEFTMDEVVIIEDAVEAALCWGTGIVTTCREALEDAGFEWTDEHEAYIFSRFVEDE